MTNGYYPLGVPCDDMSEGEYQRQYCGPEDLDGWEEEGTARRAVRILGHIPVISVS
jgi:hypothetical protein